MCNSIKYNEKDIHEKKADDVTWERKGDDFYLQPTVTRVQSKF